MTSTYTKSIYIDPSSEAYYGGRLFDHSNSELNRDDTLAPFIRLRTALRMQGEELYTADCLLGQDAHKESGDYYSLGILKNYEHLHRNLDIKLRAFVLFEPPVVAPSLYNSLPKLTQFFEHVYVHNVEGDGYSLQGVDRSRLRKLYWPQPHKDVLANFWNCNKRLRRIVMINGNHRPVTKNGEMYSKRIEALAALAKIGSVDLYGRGWERWWSRNSMWLPYWRNREMLMSIYKGACHTKYEVLSRYDFALCFENMIMNGYITEKIFDCFYAGTVPLYWGAKNVTELIPPNAYIDCRRFSSWEEMHEEIMGLSTSEIKAMRAAGKAFIQGEQGSMYFNSLNNIFNAEDKRIADIAEYCNG